MDMVNARNSLNYWKSSRCADEVFASELAFSLIYDNIHPLKMDEALATMGLMDMPEHFFLIQVDDYANKSAKLKLTREFILKSSILSVLNENLRVKNITGFAANLVGLDKIICFLCFPACEEQNDIAMGLKKIAAYLQNQVRKNTRYTISICISGLCAKSSDFPHQYSQAAVVLSSSFFAGKEIIGNTTQFIDAPASKKTAIDLDDWYMLLCAAISRSDRARYQSTIEQLMGSFYGLRIAPEQIKLSLVKLVHQLETYAIRCGIGKQYAALLTAETNQQIMRSSFADDFRYQLSDYYEGFQTQLQLSHFEPKHLFKATVEEYIDSHYKDLIQVEQIAKICNYSTGYFSRCFKNYYKQTLCEYINHYRINKSKELLLKTNLSVTEIAQQVGFHNIAYFCNYFKKQAGITPKQYREKN